MQGQVDAYTNDGIQLAGLKAKAPNPAEWDDRRRLLLRGALRHGHAQGRRRVPGRSSNGGLKDGIESGKYFEIYEKWFGPKGELPYPMTPQVRSFMLLQVVPK